MGDQFGDGEFARGSFSQFLLYLASDERWYSQISISVSFSFLVNIFLDCINNIYIT